MIAGKSGDFPGGDYFKSVFGFEGQTRGHSFPDDGRKQGVFIFQRQVPMTGISPFAAENLTFDADAVKI